MVIALKEMPKVETCKKEQDLQFAASVLNKD